MKTKTKGVSPYKRTTKSILVVATTTTTQNVPLQKVYDDGIWCGPQPAVGAKKKGANEQRKETMIQV